MKTADLKFENLTKLQQLAKRAFKINITLNNKNSCNKT